MVAAPISARLLDHYPAGLLGGIGLGIFAVGLLALALLPAAPSALDVSWRMALCGVGFGLFQSPNNHTILTTAPAEPQRRRERHARHRAADRPDDRRDHRRADFRAGAGRQLDRDGASAPCSPAAAPRFSSLRVGASARALSSQPASQQEPHPVASAARTPAPAEGRPSS